MAASSDHLETMKGTQSLDKSEVFSIFPNYFYKLLHFIHIMLYCLRVGKIQEVYDYALFFWWITLIYSYGHLCIHLIEIVNSLIWHICHFHNLYNFWI